MKDSLKKFKILFAPHEIGGQMQLMVEELRRRGYYATAATYSQEWYGHINDVHLSIDKINNKPKKHLLILLFSLWSALNYDIFHFFWGSSLYGFGRFPHLDLPLLRRMGKKIVVHFRGLELIDLAYFDYLRARTAGDQVQEPPISRPDQLRRLKKWRSYSDKMIVYGPDMLRVVPEAVVVQQAIDLRRWQPERPYPQSREDGIIRIAHAPSLRRKKGTEFVEQSVAELKALGYPIKLVLIEKVPFHQVKALYELCDFGVDQVLYGWYGKVSIELMALGKPVITYINPEWLPHCQDMPIVNAHPRELTVKLQELIESSQLRHSLGQAGQSYVQKNHDVKVIIDQCLQIYKEILTNER